MLGHQGPGQGKIGPEAEREHKGYRGLDQGRDIVGVENRQHEHYYAHAHHGQHKAEHVTWDCRQKMFIARGWR